MSLLSLLAEAGVTLKDLGTKPAKASAKAPKAPTKAVPKGHQSPPTQAKAPTPPAPTYWSPTSLVIYTARWACKCGAHGTSAPDIFVRETHGAPTSQFFQTRLRRIGTLGAHALLPIDVEVGDPAILPVCHECITPALRSPQLPLFPDLTPPPSPYVKTPVEALFDTYAQMRIDAASQRALFA